MYNSNDWDGETEVFLQDYINSLAAFGDAFQLASRSGTGKWRVNFSGITLLSSALLGKLVVLRHQISRTGGRLTLCNLASSVYEQFEQTGFNRLFHIEEEGGYEEGGIPISRQPKKPSGGAAFPETV